jgi:NAD(P)-dependent dehydrogenase (short-subunit alcohol dehydrogenase family)
MAEKPDRYQDTPPPQDQSQPGAEAEMHPKPAARGRGRQGSGRLEDKVALVTGGDSGIGRAVAVAFAREGADVGIVYLNEHEDAEETRRLVEHEGGRCVNIAGDVGDEEFCRRAVEETVEALGRLDVLVNNAAEQHMTEGIGEISSEQLERTFRTNIFAMFHLTKEALAHLPDGGAIINSASVVAYQGNPKLLDYSATKGAIVAFTRSLSQELVSRGIRVNAVAPGPIWTPLIPATFPADQVGSFGGDVPMARPGQPEEVAPSYVFLASEDSSYIAGQTLHPNGGAVVNG